ncbi:38783_t:CDS:2 [Gigaspora margarita]|uniref:38783_t:CDS:1 n=1 Tax=Gigaspora margarita TaxID=4874 RepID=A0ABM8W764_GIGMA|nr:38783_t:CDS:2 [Gigaspora margarita]
MEVKEVYANIETVCRKFITYNMSNITHQRENIFKHFNTCPKPNEIEKLLEELERLADVILKEKNAIKFESERDYKMLINHRLKDCFSYASEGNIVAEHLLVAIRNKVVNRGKEKRIHKILKISWMNSTEHARLKYFKQLAEQVQKHQYDNALMHFDNPDFKITEWFKNEVNNCYLKISQEEYNRVFEQEFSEITSKISHYKSIEEFQNFVNSYLDQIEGCEYKMHKVTEEARTNHKNTKVLDPSPCHMRANSTLVCWGERRELIEWSEAKQTYFADWLFFPHNNENFNNFMYWFFQELHAKIAKKHNLCTVNKEELKKYNCINLDYHKILVILSIEIGQACL